MENLHKPVMINEIISFLPNTKSINVIDATFGGGGYSKAILEKLNVNQLLAIDRDLISKIFSKEIESKFSNFTLINDIWWHEINYITKWTENYIIFQPKLVCFNTSSFFPIIWRFTLFVFN